MRIYLRDRNQELVNHWRKYFSYFPEVHVSCGDIFADGEHMTAEAIISPANAFAYMDGGIDLVYSNYFGWDLSTRLQELIFREHAGELLVGQAEIIEIQNEHPQLQWLICAPTMRVPMDVSRTVNAYLAFRAALLIAEKNGIQSILCPGLGTAIGKMPPRICAMQMLEAYRFYNEPRQYQTLSQAHIRHYNMISPDTWELQLEVELRNEIRGT